MGAPGHRRCPLAGDRTYAVGYAWTLKRRLRNQFKENSRKRSANETYSSSHRICPAGDRYRRSVSVPTDVGIEDCEITAVLFPGIPYSNGPDGVQHPEQ